MHLLPGFWCVIFLCAGGPRLLHSQWVHHCDLVHLQAAGGEVYRLLHRLGFCRRIQNLEERGDGWESQWSIHTGRSSQCDSRLGESDRFCYWYEHWEQLKSILLWPTHGRSSYCISVNRKLSVLEQRRNDSVPQLVSLKQNTKIKFLSAYFPRTRCIFSGLGVPHF